MEEKAQLLVGPDEKISVTEATLLGLQHVLAMDVYVPPIILAGMLQWGPLIQPVSYRQPFWQRESARFCKRHSL